MEKKPSVVYFTNFRARPGTSVLQKLEKLIRAAGIGNIDMEKKMVAIKIHFGEPGNLAYLRPNYAKTVADAVKRHATPCMWAGAKTLWTTWMPPMKTAFLPSPPAAM